MEKRRIFAECLAKEAGELAKVYFLDNTSLTVEFKRADDHVSEADRNVEQMIRQRIAEIYPEDNIVGEEEGGDESDSFWCVDPIDGTSNFLAGIPLWGVSIAYCKGGVPVVGAISIPMQDTLISAHVDRPGFYLNGEYQKGPRDSPIPMFALGESQDWARNAIRRTEDILFSAGLTVVKYRCSVVGMAYAAMGLTRGYFEHNTNIWDVAAGYVIGKQSGLKVNIKRNDSDQKLRIAALRQAEYDAISAELGL